MNQENKSQIYKNIKEVIERLLFCDVIKSIESVRLPGYFEEEAANGKAGLYVRFSQIDKNTDSLLRKFVEIEENSNFYFMEIYPHEDNPQNSVLVWSKKGGFLL